MSTPSKRLLLLSATVLEVELCLQRLGLNLSRDFTGLKNLDVDIDVLITGVGMPSCCFMLGKHVKELNAYSRILHAGFAGAYPSSQLDVGDCVQVRYDAHLTSALWSGKSRISLTCTDLPNAFTPQPVADDAELNKLNESEFPEFYRNLCFSDFKPDFTGSIALAECVALTVDTPLYDRHTFHRDVPNLLHASVQIETMESVASSMLGAALGIPVFGLRVISNYAISPESPAWDIPTAQESLAATLSAIL